MFCLIIHPGSKCTNTQIFSTFNQRTMIFTPLCNLHPCCISCYNLPHDFNFPFVTYTTISPSKLQHPLAVICFRFQVGSPDNNNNKLLSSLRPLVSSRHPPASAPDGFIFARYGAKSFDALALGRALQLLRGWGNKCWQYCAGKFCPQKWIFQWEIFLFRQISGVKLSLFLWRILGGQKFVCNFENVRENLLSV
jgi:hypothetical protein